MAITYVGGIVAAVAGSTSDTVISLSGTLTGGSDSSPSGGDLVIVTIAVGHTGDAVTTDIVTSGYTEETALTADDTRDTRLMVGYKFMPGTPDANVTISGSDVTTAAMAYTVQVFRGVDQATPMDTTITTATGLSTGRPDPASITPVTTGAWIVCCTAATNTASATFTYSDMTNELTVWSDDTDDIIIGSGYNSSWTSGAFNPAASSTGSTSVNDCWCAYTLALRPSSGTGVASWSSTGSVTWQGRSTATGAFSDVETASVTWNGAARTASSFNSAAAASVTWQGMQVWSAAANIACTASVTWNGVMVMNGSLNAAATALLTWNGRSTAGANWSSVNAAALTWNGASTAASNFDQDATASLTWNGTGLYSGALSVIAAASVTWNGAELTNVTVSAAWSAAAAASVTWAGASNVAAALSSTAVASCTWNGTGLFPGAVSAAAAASLTWDSRAFTSGDWSAVAAADLKWNGESFASSSLNAAAVSALTWNGLAIASGDWSSNAAALLLWIGEAQGAPAEVAGAWSSTATANAVFAAEVIAEAGFSMSAAALLKWNTPFIRPPNLGNSGARKQLRDDEDLAFIRPEIDLAIGAYFYDNY